MPPDCAGCRRALPLAPPPGGALCPRCAARLTVAPSLLPPRGLVFCAAAVRFEGEAESWLRRFKDPGPGVLALDGPALAVCEMLARRATRSAVGPLPDALVPVPLHPARLRRRGFNPALLLARAAARELVVPVRPRALARVRDTPSQRGLGRSARRHNVAGAFTARGPAPPRVWLVDDVVTTGATLEAAAAALRRAGAREVAALCAAWTPPDRSAGPSVVAPGASGRQARRVSDAPPPTHARMSFRLWHRPSLGDEPVSVEFAEGDELFVLRRYALRSLCRDGEGRLFNVPNDWLRSG